MKRIWPKAVLLLLCFVAPSAKSFAEPRDLYEAAVVVPGHSVGRVRLGMSRQSLRKMLGKPISSEGTKHDEWWKFVDDLPAQESGAPFISVDYVGGKVVQIAANVPGLVNHEDFSTNSTLSQIKRKLPGIKRNARYYVVDVQYVFYASINQGIGFSFNTNNGKAAGLARPDCFIVFKPGRHILPSWFSANSNNGPA